LFARQTLRCGVSIRTTTTHSLYSKHTIDVSYNGVGACAFQVLHCLAVLLLQSTTAFSLSQKKSALFVLHMRTGIIDDEFSNGDGARTRVAVRILSSTLLLPQAEYMRFTNTIIK
jgi:hypothetical protein